jgi:hypothetical protein
MVGRFDGQLQERRQPRIVLFDRHPLVIDPAPVQAKTIFDKTGSRNIVADAACSSRLQVKALGLVAREMTPGLDDLAQLRMLALDRVGADHAAHFRRVGDERDYVLPGASPGRHNGRYLRP